MPEGDTIHRAAASLRAALLERTLTRVDLPRHPAPWPAVGATITGVEARGKHLLIRSSDGLVLHTHQMMTGSWHLYTPGERWRKSPKAARAVLGVRGVTAVCFASPVVEVLDEVGLARHPALRRLGPDLCDPGADVGRGRSCASAGCPRPSGASVRRSSTSASRAGSATSTAATCCSSTVCTRRPPSGRSTSRPAGRCSSVRRAAARQPRPVTVAHHRHRRTRGHAVGLRSRRSAVPPLRTAIRSGHLGEQARLVYWCPTCQPAVAAPRTSER
jgi:endonuclease VIII